MKQLIIVRHAKSDWGSEGLKDIDRPLNERGYMDANAMSEWFFAKHEVPKKFITSDATRALSTAFLFARAMDFPTAEIVIEPKIYESDTNTLKQVIASIDNSLEYVILFGHNPGLTNLVNELASDLFFDNIPTCGMVSLMFDVKNWKDVVTGKGKVTFHQFPKEFK